VKSSDNIPQLSVIVPVHNSPEDLRRALKALANSAFREFELIVVDDCSSENTAAEIAASFGALILRTAHRMGPAGARNLGVRHARAPVVVFADADVELRPDTLGLFAAQFEVDAQLAAVFGSYDNSPGCSDFVSRYKNLFHHYIHQVSREEAVTFWAGCGAIRKDVFNELGGFDENRYLEPSIEDIELGFRVIRAGWKIRLLKELQVKHWKKWTLRNLFHSDIFRRAAPWTRLILSTRQMPRDLNLSYSSRLSGILVNVAVFLATAAPLRAARLLPRISFGWLFASIGLALLLLLILNRGLYSFFWREHGWRFTAPALLMHWFYCLYCGVVFVWCASDHLFRRHTIAGVLVADAAGTCAEGMVVASTQKGSMVPGTRRKGTPSREANHVHV
jgi:glycosyltransferase involved in cell wall biosynthesis